LAQQAQSGAYKSKESNVDFNFNAMNEDKAADVLSIFYRSQAFGKATT